MLTLARPPSSHFWHAGVACCASTPPAPVRVEVPVMVPCIGEVPPRPAYEFDELPATATDGEIILALARD